MGALRLVFERREPPNASGPENLAIAVFLSVRASIPAAISVTLVSLPARVRDGGGVYAADRICGETGWGWAECQLRALRVQCGIDFGPKMMAASSTAVPRRNTVSRY